jgi:hypothetical protein
MNEKKKWWVAGNSEHHILIFLICTHIAIGCISLVYTSVFHENFHIIYDPARLSGAVAVVAAFTLVASLFTFARFSFGYFIAYYLYIMVAGYLWINYFTDLNYDRQLAGLSAAASAIVFFLPAMLLTSPVPQIWTISARAFDRLLIAILVVALATIFVAASYNFRIVDLGNLHEFRNELFSAHIRNELKAPAILNYMVGITTSALLPFTFACFTMRKQYWHASAVLVLLLLFFPITLSKLSLFTPAWLVFIALLSKLFKPRIAVVLSLFLPMLSGLIVIMLFRASGGDFFDLLVFRMFVIPSNALAVYNDFFFQHPPTYFCQISVLKPLLSCPYRDQLGIVMERAYGFGNFNASLFATEGIASVGTAFAPLSVLICGIVISLGNRISAGLPFGLVMISSAILPQVLLNVALTTAFLTHGVGLLYLLWYITPRAAFEPQQTERQ